MKSQSHTHPIKPPKRRLGRLLWMLGFAAAVIGLAYLFSGWMLGPRIRQHLERQTGAAVYLESAHWIGPASIRLENLVIASDPQRLSETSIVQVRRVDCSFSPAQLLRLRLGVRSVTVEDAVIQTQYDHDLGQWNFSSLPFMNEPREPSRVPVVLLRNSMLRVQTLQNGRIQTLAQVGLGGRILSEEKGRRYRFSLKAEPRGSFYGSRFDGIWNREKGRGRVTLYGQIRMPLIYVYGNAWNLEQIRLDCSYQKDSLTLDRFSCRMGEGTVDVRGLLSGPPTHKTLDIHVQMENLYLAQTSRPDAIVCSEEILNMLDPGLQRFLRRFGPEGRADATVQIQGRLSDLSQSRITGSIVCRDIAVEDQKFPYRLENMTGPIELAGKNLTLAGLRARHGPSFFVIGGGVENIGPDARIQIHLTSDEFHLSEDVKQALPEPLQLKWFEFAPAGICAVQYDFERRADGTKYKQVKADLLGAQCLYDRYPYPLTNLTGTIIFNPDSVELRNVISRPGGEQEIRIEGTVGRIRTPAPDCDLRIRTRRLALNRTLLGLFQGTPRQILEDFDAQGQLDLDLSVQGVYEEHKALPCRAVFTVQADSLTWKRFPLTLHQVLLNGSLDPGILKIDSLSAAAGQGQVRGSGQIHRAGSNPSQPGGAVSFSAEDLALDADFWRAMQAARVHPNLFSRIRAEGVADLNGQFLVNDPQTSSTEKRLTIQFKEGALVSASEDWKSGPASGIIHLRDAQVALQDFTVTQMPVNDAFFHLAAPATEDLAVLHPSAVLDVRIHQAQWEMASPSPSYEVQGQIEIRQGSLPAMAVDQLEGLVQGRLTRRPQEPSAQGSGQFLARSFQVLDRTITDLAGPWSTDPNSGLTCPAVTAQCYEGAIRARAVFQSHQPQVPFRAEMEFENIHLEPFLKAGQTEGAEPTKEADQHFAEGRLRGSIGLSGRLRHLDRTEGRVYLEAHDLKIGRESLFGKALSVMQLRQPEEYVFNEMFVEAYLSGRRLSGERILFAGKNDVYQGQGTLDLADRTIQMELTAFGRRKGQEPTLLTALAENLGAALAKVQITGTLDQPVVTKVGLPILPRPF